MLANALRAPATAYCGVGACGKHRVIRADGSVQRLDYAETVAPACGDAIEIRTPGGGGYGESGT